MFDRSMNVANDEEEMGDFHDYEDEEQSGTGSKFDEFEDDEDCDNLFG